MTLRILMTADAVGGVWTYALDLARGLAPHGVQILLALIGPAPNPDQRRAAAQIATLTLIETGLPLDWLAETPEKLTQAGEAIRELGSAHQVDLVHLNTPALVRPGRSLPTVTVAHSCVASWWEAVRGGDLPADFAWRTDMHAAGLRAADAAIAPSTAFAAATHRLYGVRPAVVHNGRAPLAARPADMRDEALTVGRLWDEGKNVRVLERAAAGLAFPLFAAGPLTGVNGAANQLEHARPLGVLTDDDLADRYAARPVFVSAALYEPFGLAVLEAAQAGCALVLSDIPTFRELWEGCATFVDRRDEAGFAAAIAGLIDDRDLRLAQGDAAKERARRYTPAAMAAETLAVYRSVLPATEAVAA